MRRPGLPSLRGGLRRLLRASKLLGTCRGGDRDIHEVQSLVPVPRSLGHRDHVAVTPPGQAGDPSAACWQHLGGTPHYSELGPSRFLCPNNPQTVGEGPSPGAGCWGSFGSAHVPPEHPYMGAGLLTGHVQSPYLNPADRDGMHVQAFRSVQMLLVHSGQRIKWELKPRGSAAPRVAAQPSPEAEVTRG